MGTLLRFPEIASTRRDLRNRDLSQIIPDLICQLESLQSFAEGSVSEALSRLETAIETVDAIGRLLPPGEFKTQFDLGRSSLSKQLYLVKGINDGLRKHTDLEGLSALLEPKA
jgi:hypothetical protein